MTPTGKQNELKQISLFKTVAELLLVYLQTWRRCVGRDVPVLSSQVSDRGHVCLCHPHAHTAFKGL